MPDDGGTFDPSGYGASLLDALAALGNSPSAGGSSSSAAGTTTATTDGTDWLTREDPVSRATRDGVETFVAGAGSSLATEGGNNPGNIDGEAIGKTLDDGQWRERVANYSPWNDVFSVTHQETSLVIDVPYANRRLFLAAACGLSWVDGTRLKRINPMKHPYYPWMRAARVGHTGVRYVGSKVYVGGNSNRNAVARYKLARFTVAFTNYPWKFLEDGDVANDTDEWKRNAWFEEEPTAQMMAAEGGNSVMNFAGDLSSYSSGPGLENTKPRTFKAPFGTVLSQIRYVLHWKWVPYDYVFKGMVPVNLYAAMNKLNNAAAFDVDGNPFAKGTLLVEPPKITKYACPIRFLNSPAYLCDIDLHFTFFDPPRGITSGGLEVWRGHNLMPWRVNNLWYPATRVGAPTVTDVDNYGLFPYTDLSKLFQRPT